MYKIRLFTSQWEFYLTTDAQTLPDGEFIKVKNTNWDTYYINRKEVLAYRVIKHENQNDRDW